MQQLLQDLHFSSRMMRKNPAFFLVVILTLSLGIGVTTAVFSIVNGVVLRPLAYKDSDRIMVLFEERRSDSSKAWGRIANFLDWREQNQVFEHLAHYKEKNFTFTGEGEPEVIAGAATAANFFSVLGEEPFIGRGFQPEDEQGGAEPVVILSHELWQKRFGGDQSWLGRTITLDSEAHEIIGVMPPEFRFPYTARQKLWTSRVFSEEERANRDYNLIMVLGRLQPGVSLGQAQADMDRVTHDLEELYPSQNEGWGVWMISLKEWIVGDMKFALLMILGGVTIVLLMACANVINLLLARGTERERELALRVALGAGRRRLIRHFLTESLVLSALGALGGLLFVVLSTKLLVALDSGSIPRLDEVDVDIRVLGFTLACALIVTVALGLTMSLRTFGASLVENLKQGTVLVAKESGPWKLRNLVVAVEIGLVLGFLILGTLMLRSYRELTRVDPGFERDGRFAVEVALPNAKYPDAEAVNAFFDELLEKIDALPDVESSAVATNLPLSGRRWGGSYLMARGGAPEAAERALFDYVSPDYFQTMGILLIEGRGFTQEDGKEARAVTVVNKTMADKHWADGDPLSGHIYLGPDGSDEIDVIGVVENVKYQDLDAESAVKYYRPNSQITYTYSTRQVVVRTRTTDPVSSEALVSSIRKAVLTIDEGQPINKVLMLEDLVSNSIAHHRFNMLLFMILGPIGLILGGVGVYGVVSYSAGRRTREMGIRLSLGARRADVLKLVVATELIPVLVGVALGIATALALSRTMSSLLYGVSAIEPGLYAGASCVLLVVALWAIFVPAYQASRVDPQTAIRYE